MMLILKHLVASLVAISLGKNQTFAFCNQQPTPTNLDRGRPLYKVVNMGFATSYIVSTT